MRFNVLSVGVRPPSSGKSEAYLVCDHWDDWFKYSTLFHLHVFDSDGVLHKIGDLKIGQFDMKDGQRSPALPDQFDQLDDVFFSLGLGDNYYGALNDLGEFLRDTILTSLRDVAADLELFDRALQEDVTVRSLLRGVTHSTVRGQYNRMTRGGARLSRYEFTYEAPKPRTADISPVKLSFEIEPDSSPPTNIHVLIGRNGVGKTYLFSAMTNSILDEGGSSSHGSFLEGTTDRKPFANLVSVSFSAFDEFELKPDTKGLPLGVGYAYVGLRRTSKTGKGIGSPKSPVMMKKEFVKSVKECLIGVRKPIWKAAIETLQTDPVFSDADIISFVTVERDKLEKHASSIFGKLSSGHKIILLTITRLVELVEERTLVLLDEPEAHLHPPLLSAFIRVLSDLLIHRNGVAMIATHSPVVLQEVPRDCVWMLRRSGSHTTAERPHVETFGENVGVLTREVFGLEVTHSGFHDLLRKSARRRGDYNAVLEEYDGKLGAEARAMIRALVSEENGDVNDA
jgi:predicted ATPase